VGIVRDSCENPEEAIISSFVLRFSLLLTKHFHIVEEFHHIGIALDVSLQYWSKDEARQ
jgi:hypothetical protein